MFGKKINTTITISGMHCAHCAKRVETAFGNLAGVTKVHADYASGKVEIVSKSPLDSATLKSVTEELGYTLVD